MMPRGAGAGVIVAMATTIGGLTLGCGHVEGAEAVTPVVVRIWPDGAPGAPGVRSGAAERTLPARGDNVTRITDVTDPTITVYRPSRAEGLTAAVLVCPGGGYNILAFDKEGTEVAAWLGGLGIAAAVLKYRVPRDRAGAFQDAQRAMGVVRSRAREWGIDPDRLGILGFSAGGHLSARVSTHFEKRSYDRVDGADDLSCRPDFTVLVYPAYLVRKKGGLVAEVEVSKGTPPTFLVQTQDDRIRVENSVEYFLALKRAGVRAELHVYPEGGHGYGLRPSKHAVSRWPELCGMWLGRVTRTPPNRGTPPATPKAKR